MSKTIDTYGNNLINVEKNKKVQEVLGKEETQKLLKNNYEKYKKIEEKIHILNKTQEEILKLKQELSGTPEEKADKLLKILEKKENPIKQVKSKVEETTDNLKTKVDEKVDEVIDKTKDAVLEKTGITGMMDKFSGMFDKFSSMFDTIWKKITAAFAGTALGAWLGFEASSDEENKEDEKEEEKTKKDNKKENSKVEEKTPDTKKETKEETKTTETVETKKIILYKAGIKTMLSLTGIDKVKNKDNDGILDKISQKKYKYIINLEENEKKQYLGGDSIQTFNTIIEQLKSKKFETIANYNFKGEFIKNIILDENGEINEQLVNKITGGKTRLQEILDCDKSNNNWWKKELSIAEIALFYTHSFGFLNIPNTGSFESKGFMGGLLFNKTEFNEIKENNIVPEKIVKNFVKIGGTDFGATELLNNDDKSRKSVGNGLNHNEKDKLDKLIKFKNYLLNDYLDIFKPKIEGNNIKLFKNNLNYKSVIALYSIMGGKKLNNNINVTNKISIAYVNSKIIGGFAGNSYLGKIFYDIIADQHSIFTDDEMDVLSIYKDKAYDIAIGAKLNEIGKQLGFVSGLTNTDLDSIAIKMGVGGVVSYMIGGELIKRKIEKKGISIIGMFAKKLGFLSMLGGIAIGGYSFYNKEHIKPSLGEDLKKAGNDSEKILEILKNYKDSITKPVDGKEIRVIKYKDDTPLIIMDEKIYTFDIIDAPLLEKFKNTDYSKIEGWEEALKDGARTIFSWLLDSNSTKVNGQVINRNDINIDGNTISFGEEGEKVDYSIDKLFEGIGNKKIQIDKSTIKKIKKYFKEELGKEIPYVNGEDINFYKLKKLTNGKFISLVQIGETYPQKNGN